MTTSRTHFAFALKHQRCRANPDEDHEELQEEASEDVHLAMSDERVLARVNPDAVQRHGESKECGDNYDSISYCRLSQPCRFIIGVPPIAIAGVTPLFQYPR